MKQLFFTLTALIIITTTPALSMDKSPVVVQVSGMVCDFCAQSIMKVFQKETGLTNEQIDISLDTQEITLTIPDGLTITDEQIEKFIYFAGYDLVEIRRPQSHTPDHSSDE
jgi:copper chaperone CopZ